jgi:thymidylate synthase
MNSWHQEYRSLLSRLHHGTEEVNARTRVRIKMLEGGHSFKLDLRDGRLPVAGNRRYFPRVAAAEAAWQFMGTKDPAFIVDKAPRLWEKFVEDGELKTAYGYRWRRHFGRDQLAMAMYELVHNPTNRQLYISAWDPATDGLGGPQPKNIPCPVGFSLTRVDYHLHCSVFIRSSDVFVGLPYDVMCYAMTVDAVAAQCALAPGTLHVTLAHPHVYEPHFDLVRRSLDAEWLSAEPNLPGYTVDMITSDPDAYLAQVKRLSARVPWMDWNPYPDLVE